MKAVDAAGNGAEMNKFYLDQLSTHPDLAAPNVLDVLKELSEVATLAVVTNGFDRVQSRRVAESGMKDFIEEVFVSKSWTVKSRTARSSMQPSARWAWRTGSMC